ncbi:MAG: DUF4293 domain-containing protein [Rikenellaceae bacterium]
MIQRIQSVYLLFAAIFMTIVAVFPLAYFTGENQFFNLYAIGLKDLDGVMAQSTIYMFALVVASAILPFVALFLFKRRMLQIRLCVVEAVLLVGSCIMIGAYIFLSHRAFSGLELFSQGYKPILVLPVVSIFLVFFAAKAIFKDELLIRSVDRIR